jgi:hypothetical protein
MKPHTSIRNSISNCSLNWYSLPTGGTSTQTSPTPSTSTVGLTSYYVSQTIATTGCEGPRSEIIVTVNPRPTAPVAIDRLLSK